MNSRTRKVAAMAGMLSIATVLVGCGTDAPGSGYETPEACFEAMTSSLSDGDFPSFVDCMTDKSQQMMAGAAVVIVSATKAVRGFAAMGNKAAMAQVQAEFAPIDAVLESNGLDDATLQQVGSEAAAMGVAPNAEALQGTIAKVGDAIADPRKFLIDFFVAASQLEGEVGEGLRSMATNFTGRLSNLNIEGDEATATIVRESGEMNMPIAFRKTPTGWKSHVDVTGLHGAGEAEPAAGVGPEFDFSAEFDESGERLEQDPTKPGALEAEGIEMQLDVDDADKIDLQLEEERAGSPE